MHGKHCSVHLMNIQKTFFLFRFSWIDIPVFDIEQYRNLEFKLFYWAYLKSSEKVQGTEVQMQGTHRCGSTKILQMGTKILSIFLKNQYFPHRKVPFWLFKYVFAAVYEKRFSINKFYVLVYFCIIYSCRLVTNGGSKWKRTCKCN